MANNNTNWLINAIINKKKPTGFVPTSNLQKTVMGVDTNNNINKYESTATINPYMVGTSTPSKTQQPTKQLMWIQGTNDQELKFEQGKIPTKTDQFLDTIRSPLKPIFDFFKPKTIKEMKESFLIPTNPDVLKLPDDAPVPEGTDFIDPTVGVGTMRRVGINLTKKAISKIASLVDPTEIMKLLKKGTTGITDDVLEGLSKKLTKIDNPKLIQTEIDNALVNVSKTIAPPTKTTTKTTTKLADDIPGVIKTPTTSSQVIEQVSKQAVKRNLSDDIISKSLRNFPSQEFPEITIVSGRSASGKSAFVRQIVEKYQPGNIVVDADQIKKFLPHKDKVEAHMASSEIAQSLLRKAIEERKNITFVGIIKNTPKYEELLSRLRAAGYRINARGVDAPEQVITKRLVERSLGGQPVPLSVGKATGPEYVAGLDILKKYADDLRVYSGVEDFKKQILGDPIFQRIAPDKFIKQYGEKPSAFQFISPNIQENTTRAWAKKQLTGERQAMMRSVFDDIDNEVGVIGKQYNGIGDWSDGAENTVYKEIFKDTPYEQNRYSAALKGLAADQKAVIPFNVDKNGPNRLYIIKPKEKSIDKLAKLLDNEGIQFRTFVKKNGEMNIVIFDEDGSLLKNTIQFNKKYGRKSKPKAVRGRGEFLGSFTSRAEGRREYRRVISEYEGATGSRVSSRLDGSGRPRDAQGVPSGNLEEIPTKPPTAMAEGGFNLGEDETITLYRASPELPINGKFKKGTYFSDDAQKASYYSESHLQSGQEPQDIKINKFTLPKSAVFKEPSTGNYVLKEETSVKIAPEAQKGLKERQFIQTAREAPITSKEVKEGLISPVNPDNYYLPQSNKALLAEAEEIISRDIDEALRIVDTPGPATAKSNIIAQKLVVQFQNEGRFEDAINIVEKIAQKSTNQGQAIQALSVYNRLTPEGVVKYTEKLIRKANEKRIKPIKLDPKKAEEIVEQSRKASSLPEGRQKVVETARLLDKIMSVIPTSIGQKIGAIQTMAQLLNPKTFNRNLVGNLGFAAAENAKDFIATPLDSALALITKKRTTALPSFRTQIGGFGKGLAEGVEDAMQRINTSMINTQFDLPKTNVFKGKVMGSLEKLLNLELRATDRAFYQAAYDGSLYQQMKATGIKVPTEEMKEVAHFEALYKTFQDDNWVSKVFVGLKRTLNKIGIKDFGMGDFVLKYPKTPANLLARGIDYSPGGFVNSLFQALKPVVGRPFDQKKFVDSFSRAMLGTGGLIGAGALMHRLGIITGRPEKDIDIKGIQRISGLGQYKINFSALKRFVFSGFNPEAAKMEPGDMLVSYDWFQPMAIPLSMGANIDEGGGAEGQAMSIIQSMTEGINTLQEQPLVSGVRRLLMKDSLSSTIEESLKGIPSSFIPTILNQVNQLIDNTQRNSYDPDVWQYAFNLAKAKIPGLAQTLPPAIDAFGEDLNRYQGDSNNIFNVFFNPAFTSWYKPTPESQMVLDLMEITGETKQAPRLVNKSYKINGVDKKLSPKQITALQRYVGTITKELFASFAADSRFQALPPDEKIKYLSGVLTDIGAAGKIVILGDRPKKPSKDAINIIRLFSGKNE